MHSIKRAARRQAWYHNNDGDNTTYNPFGRGNAPRRQRDLEGNTRDGGVLEHTATENDAVSPIEAKRRSGYNAEKEGFGGPKHAGTYPASSSNAQPQRSSFEESEFQGPNSLEKEEKASGISGSTVAPTETRSPPNGVVEQSVGGSEGAKKRKSRKFHIPFTKKKEEEGGEPIERSESYKKNHPKLSIMSQAKAVFGSYINILLIAVPVGIALEYAHVNKIAVFVVNFITIIPLAAMLSYATEELAMYVGETLGGLLNASFGNAVELIVSIIALAQGKILIVQTSLIGSMLSNLLLVMGMCFFFGGLKRR
ncbi:hypothetical protein LTR95_017255, partial [Oleoguttula sp. CCFEE 5521]